MPTSSSPPPLYPSRAAAGTALGRLLYQRFQPPIILLGVTPTGVEIAANAAQALSASFDVIVGAHVRMEGLGIVGALAEDGDAVIDREFQPRFGMVEPLNQAIDRARRAVKTERLLFRGQRQIRPLEESVVVVVDGHATSPWKLLAAATTVQTLGANTIAVAAAAASQAVKERVSAYKFPFICPSVLMDATGHPRPFGDPEDPSAERLRSIVVARQAA